MVHGAQVSASVRRPRTIRRSDKEVMMKVSTLPRDYPLDAMARSLPSRLKQNR